MELERWWCAPCPPGPVGEPLDAELDWVAASVPGTAAAAWLAAGRIADVRELDVDGYDWWYRCDFTCDDLDGTEELVFDGLATICEVWLNGVQVARSTNMFAPLRAPVGSVLRDHNRLDLAFRALRPALTERRARPRWKANFVEHQNLRWLRTSLLGRMPSWTAPCAAVGPFRPVQLRRAPPVLLHERKIVATPCDGGSGTVAFEGRLTSRSPLRAVTLRVGDAQAELDLAIAADAGEGVCVSGSVVLDTVALWWPATHGSQPRYPACLVCVTDDGVEQIVLPEVGFRALDADFGDAPRLVVNGVPIFARGAWWVTPDPIGLTPTSDALREALEQLRDAGCNLLMVPANGCYESPEFFDLCDELGLLVWQQLMFTRLDYPHEDAGWRVEAHAEIDAVVRDLAGHPSVAVVCGGFEVAQQAAMLGVDVDATEWFGGDVAARVDAALPGVAYLADTPHRGTHPFSVSVGTATYYGVGAYGRSLDDARRSGVRFASGCLAFSNVAADESTEAFIDGGAAIHSAAWKRAIPRDRGAAWDMEDTRDLYVAMIYGVDPFTLRRTDPDRYLDYGRAATSRAMAHAMSEWRRPRSGCAGALVLQARDYVAGPGAGVIDATGRTKPVFYALKRVMSPVAVLLHDEGLSGLDVWVVNDTSDALDAALTVTAFANDHIVETATVPCRVGAHAHWCASAEAALGGFYDVTYAFRFGPPELVGVAATVSVGDVVIARGVHRLNRALTVDDVGLSARAHRLDEGRYDIVVSATRAAHFVQLAAKGATFSDQGFDLEPGGSLHVAATTNRPLRAHVRALNGAGHCAVQVCDD